MQYQYTYLDPVLSGHGGGSIRGPLYGTARARYDVVGHGL